MTRLVALLIALLFTASTAGAEWLACQGSGPSPASSHACCEDMQMVHSAAQAAGCCAVSEQTRTGGPVAAKVAPALSVAVPAYRPAVAAPAAVAPRPSVRAFQLHLSAVPIYLQQHSLLI